jgi:hypothetical protein
LARLSTNNYLSRREPRAKADLLSKLFIHDLDLLVEHLTGEPIDRNMDPIMLFPLHNELGRSAACGF